MLKILLVTIFMSLGVSNVYANQEEKPVKVLAAAFNSKYKSVDVLVRYSGCGYENGDTFNMRVRGCADLYMPYTCIADFSVKTKKGCNEDRFLIVPFFLEELGLQDAKYRKSTLIIKGSKSTNTEVEVILERI